MKNLLKQKKNQCNIVYIYLPYLNAVSISLGMLTKRAVIRSANLLPSDCNIFIFLDFGALWGSKLRKRNT